MLCDAIFEIFERAGKIMLKKVLRKIEYRSKTSMVYNFRPYFEKMREGKRGSFKHDNNYHLVKAINWLKRAQDATPDGGVSRGYSMAWNPYFESKGWQPSYPETTGYIIPTFFDCSKRFDDFELFQRALKMAKWEIEIQMESGAVRGGVVDHGDPIPAVFCTGQVILGWVRTYTETGDTFFITAAEKAGNFLLGVQNEEGTFVEDDRYMYANRNTTTYHTRVAWALILLGKVTNKKEYVEAGIRNLEFNLENQEDNGWFKNNCLRDAEKPLLHTICYAARGFLETGLLLDSEEYYSAAKLTSDQLLSVLKKNEYLPGRLKRNWEGSVNWSCLTGDAQLAIIWLKLYQKTHDRSYLEGAHRVIEFLKSKQNCITSELGLKGGIKGSYPFDGVYGKFEILNWATKFFVDALLLEGLINEENLGI